MPKFKILPADQSYSSAEITAADAAAVLGVVGQLNCRDADVLQDDVYSFSLRLNESGMWSIYQRNHDAGATTAFG